MITMKNLWILVWNKLLVYPVAFKVMHGNCLFRAVAQEITGSQEDHAALRELVTSFMTHNPTQLCCYLKSSETMENYLQRTKMDRQKVWATEVEIYTTANLLGTTIFVYCPSGTSNKSMQCL